MKHKGNHPNMVWEYIANDIEFMIINGDLKAADRVPSISELSEHYGVSKSTAQKALEDLCTAGVITKRKGVGYFVMPAVRKVLKMKQYKYLVTLIEDCINQARRLHVDDDTLLKLISDTLQSDTLQEE